MYIRFGRTVVLTEVCSGTFERSVSCAWAAAAAPSATAAASALSAAGRGVGWRLGFMVVS